MPTRANRKPALPLLLGTCAVLLAACSGASPAPSPTTSPRTPVAVATSPSATPVPTPTLPEPAPSPTPPPEMARADEAGAVAAVTYFLTDLYRYTVTSQDTSAWLTMSHDECVYCTSIASGVDTVRNAGKRTTLGGITILDITVELTDPAAYGIKLDIAFGSGTITSPDGSQATPVAAHNMAMGVIAVWQVDHWLIRGVDVLSAVPVD